MDNRGSTVLKNRTAGICRAFVLAGFLGVYAATSSAASIAYPDQGPVAPGVTFTNIVESSATDPVPLYGAPTPFATGLDFDPLAFAAVGNAGSSDITDGQLNFAVKGAPGVGLSSISLFEAGDYSLAGAGTAVTRDFAGAIVRVTVTQINGVDVAPISLAPVNASVSFNLIANPGVVQPWSLGLNLNIASQLVALGFSPTQNATGVEVVIDNQMLALSEAGSIAFIDKTDFRISVGTTTVVPEPGTVALLGFGGLMAAVVLFRRRSERA